MKRPASISAILLLLLLSPSLLCAGEEKRQDDKRTDIQKRQENLATANYYLGLIFSEKKDWAKVLEALNAYEHEYSGFPEYVLDALILRAKACAELDKQDGLAYTVRFIDKIIDDTPKKKRGKGWVGRQLEVHGIARGYFARKADEARKQGKHRARIRFEQRAADYLFGPLPDCAPKILDLEFVRTKLHELLDDLIGNGKLDTAKLLLDGMRANSEFKRPLFIKDAIELYEVLGDAYHARGRIGTARDNWENCLRCRNTILGGFEPKKAGSWIYQINGFRVMMKLGHYKIVYKQIKNLLLIYGEYKHPEELEKIQEEARKLMGK